MINPLIMYDLLSSDVYVYCQRHLPFSAICVGKCMGKQKWPVSVINDSDYKASTSSLNVVICYFIKARSHQRPDQPPLSLAPEKWTDRQ